MGSIVLALGRKILPSSLYERLASSSIARRLARGSLWSLFGSASARLLVLVAMILVARVLGQVSFGELGLIQSTFGMAGLMAGVGLGETATRFVVKYATSEPPRAGRVIALVTYFIPEASAASFPRSRSGHQRNLELQSMEQSVSNRSYAHAELTEDDLLERQS